MKNIYPSLLEARRTQQKKLAVLIDPDKLRLGNLDKILVLAIQAKVDYFFIGGSLVIHNVLDFCIQEIKKATTIPTVLFPGDISQISNKADAFLYLSLISGRNAEFLIGKHVVAAPILKRSALEIIPTGYMLIDGGSPTTALYISNTTPIPNNRPEIAVCTAMAGELLGLKLIYMDAGSGADRPVSESMIAAVAKNIDVPLIIGGGIKTPEKAAANVRAGADVVVIGNAFEQNPSLILEISEAVHAQSN